ncbi:MAG: DMT family transporter [Actinobacteria bacterium]|nr:DMT family transporter [Actinomycetota bacterium]
MIAAIFAAIGSALLYALASVLQQQAAVRIPAGESLRIGLLARLVRRPLWLVGIGCDALGYVLQAVSLALGSLVLVQPLLVTGLLFALPLGARVSRQRMGSHEWSGALSVSAGLALFLIAANPGEGRADAGTSGWIALAAATAVGVLVALAAARGPQGPRRAASLAAAAGITFAFAAVLTKTATHLLGDGAHAFFRAWQPYALLGTGGAGMLFIQSAFQAGPLAASLPMLTAAQPVAAVVMGATALGETVQFGTFAIGGEVAGLVAILGGVFVLGRSPVVLAGYAVSTSDADHNHLPPRP